MDAAVSVVSRRGYRNASLAAIAREAGVSKGLVWHYFADGDDLMEQTARSTLVALREVVARDVDLSAEVPQVIRQAIRRVAALRDTHGPQLRALQEIVQNLRRPDGSQRLGLRDYEETYALQAKLFQRGQDEGSLRRLDTRYMAVTYQGAVDTMLAYLDSHPGTDADEYAAAVADILLTGLAANQPRTSHV
ncbi:MAG TPA: TetR/AcrR family transcriptional regulator [Streptosporangiaceae bacterium]|nr:TetR/AcrR family transcriptional regulator [Streptosporangiaceae bacterium]